MLRIFKIFIVVGLAVIVGCGAARQGTRNENPTRGAVYMLIVNEGYDQIRVYDNFSRIATLSSGQKACVRLKTPEIVTQFSFSYLASREKWYTPVQNFTGFSGWRWVINSRMPINSINRMMTVEPCGNHLIGTRYSYR